MEEVNIISIVNSCVGSTSRFGIINVVIIRLIAHILVLATIFHVLTLLFGIRFFRVAHTHTSKLLCYGSNGVDVSMEHTSIVAASAQHITNKVGCHLLLFIVVRKLNAESILKSRDNCADTFVGKVVAIGYHIQYVCLNAELRYFRLDSNARYLSTFGSNLTHLNKLARAIRFAQSQFLHIPILSLYNVYFSTTTTRIKPTVYVVLRSEEACLYFTCYLFFCYNFRVILRIVCAVMRMLHSVIGTYGRKETKMLQVFYFKQSRLVEGYAQVGK